MWPSQNSHSDTVIVAWQLGNGHIRRQFWEVSASGASTFMPAHEVNDTIEAMRDARQMTVRVLPSAGRVITSSFDVRGFRDAIGWLIDTDRQKMSRGRLNHFTIGSSKSDVQTIHGPPMSVSQSSNGENWKYPGYSSVMFSSSTGGVVGWDNDSGDLKTHVDSGPNATSRRTFSMGSHKDDVFRIHGTPWWILVRSEDDHDWYFRGFKGLKRFPRHDENRVTFDSTNRVKDWYNGGGVLKVSESLMDGSGEPMSPTQESTLMRRILRCLRKDSR